MNENLINETQLEALGELESHCRLYDAYRETIEIEMQDDMFGDDVTDFKVLTQDEFCRFCFTCTYRHDRTS